VPSIKISALTEKATMAGTEEVLINDSGTSKKFSTQRFLDIKTDSETAKTAAETAKAAAETAETNAETSETNALASKNAAAISATTATTKATAASSSETAAASSATAAAASATAAQSSEDDATIAQTAAELAETHAETAETNAETAETAAETAETAAVSAKTSAESAQTSATASATSATASASSATASASGASSSATDAQSSEDDAATSETNAATSATTATTKATSATSSASSATTSASTATTKASEASTSATNAATSATASATSATAAATSATASATSKTAAETAETNAETAQTAAETAKTASETAKTASQTAKTAAETAETNASGSATSASSSSTSASGSASTATTKAATATTQASTATTKASEASTSATNSASSASSADTSATTATTKAATATTKASEASTSASNASSSASSATTAQSAAESARDSALAAFDSFDDRYLGQKSSDPTTDNDGNTLVAGTLYFNTTSDSMFVYEGSTWVAAYASLSGALLQTNNLSDLNSAGTARTNLGVDAAGTVNYTHPTSAGNKHIPTSGSSGQFLKYSASGTAVWAADNNTTYSVGDGGLTQVNFTTADNSKLDGIATSANNFSLPTSSSSVLGGIKVGTNLSIASGVLSSTDTNTTYSVGDGGLTQKNFTTTLKTKLDGIATSANNYSLPSSVVHDTEKGSLHATDALRLSGHTVSLYKGDGTSESVTIPDNNTTYSVGDNGLTAKNFTSTLKTKLDGIATSANNYSLPSSVVHDSELSSSTSSTSTTTAANSAAVKSAYDTGNHSHPYAATSHTHSYVSEGGTSFSGEYPIVVRVAGNNFYSDVNMKFRGSTSTLTVDGGIVIAGGTAWHSNNDGAGSGLDADTVSGFTVAKSVPSNAVFTDTDTNTTYSTGAGLSTSGTTFSLDLTNAQNWVSPQRASLITDNDGSFNMSQGNNFKCTPSGNFTFTFTNISNGQSGFILLVNSGGHTISKASTTKTDANLLATITAAGTYLVSYLSDGTNVYLTNSAIYT
jgi:hypothetical protein